MRFLLLHGFTGTPESFTALHAPEGQLTLDWDDEITSGACVTRPESAT